MMIFFLLSFFLSFFLRGEFSSSATTPPRVGSVARREKRAVGRRYYFADHD